MRRLSFAIAALLFLAIGTYASATPVTINASYTVTSFDPALNGLVNVGDTGSGTWIIDTAGLIACVLPACPTVGLVPGQQLYIDPTTTSISMTSILGPWSFASTPGSSNLLISNNATLPGPPPTALDSWQPLSTVTPVGPTIPVAPGNLIAVGLFLGDTTQTAQSDTSLFIPSSTAGYNALFFTLTEFDPTGAPVKNLLFAALDSYVVPEPSLSAFLASALAALALRPRQR